MKAKLLTDKLSHSKKDRVYGKANDVVDVLSDIKQIEDESNCVLLVKGKLVAFTVRKDEIEILK